MTAPDTGHTVRPQAKSAVAIRAVSWALLAMLLALLTNNVLNISFEIDTQLRVDNPLPFLTYIIPIFVAFLFARGTPSTALRTDADRIHRLNLYLVRSLFWGVFLVGMADVTVAFLRVEGLAESLLWEGAAKDLNKPFFVGLKIHIPLLVFGFILGAITRTAGFLWLALLIVIAELAIVVSRFVFSYEQAFMGDLVRYWYAALFLFASAYTLYDEGHVRVDIVYAGLRDQTKGYSNFIGTILLGLSTCWAILLVGLDGKQALINMPILNFEVSQAASIGLFIKYQMAAFLGVFAITMYIQFVSYMLEAWADVCDEPGKREINPTGH